MPIPLQYDISATGEAQLRRVFKSIEAEAVASNRRLQSRLGVTGRAGGGGRAGASGAVVADRAAKSAALAAERDAKKIANAAVRAEEKAAAARIRTEQKVWAEKVREAKSAAREQVRIEQSVHAKRMADAKMERKARAASVVSMGKGAAASVGNSIRGIAGYGGMAAAALGGLAAHSAVSQQITEQKMASELANQAGKPQIKKQLLDESRQYKGATGEEILGGISKFVEKTGDLDAARGVMGALNELSIATGASMEDLGAAAGAVFVPIADQIADPIERMKQMKDVMRGIAQQGALGAVEMKDFAVEMGPLAAVSRSFKGGASEMIRGMGALAQLAVQRGGASSAAEASTAVASFGKDVVMNQKSFKAKKMDVFADKGRTILKAPQDIMAEVAEKTKGDLVKLQELGFGERSIRVVRGLMPVYNEAEKKKKGSGKKALLAEYEKFAGATLDESGVRSRVASRLADPDMQIKEAGKAFNTAIGTELIPVLTKLIPEFVKLLPELTKVARGFASFATSLIEHPIVGIGSIIAAKLVADIGSAAIGEALSKAITTRLAGGAAAGAAGGAGGVGGKGTGLGMLGAVGVGAAVGIGVGSSIYEGGTSQFDIAHQGTNELMKTMSTMTPETFSKNANLIQERMAELSKQSGTGGMLDTLLSAFGGGTEGEFKGVNEMFAKKTGEATNFQANRGVGGAEDPNTINATSFADLVAQQTAASEKQRDAARALMEAADQIRTAAKKNPIKSP